MKRIRKIVILSALAVAPLAQAAAQSGAASDQQAKYADQALKSCNYDLDHGHFEDYPSIDDCVADRAQKLARQDQAKSAASNAPKRH